MFLIYVFYGQSTFSIKYIYRDKNVDQSVSLFEIFFIFY